MPVKEHTALETPLVTTPLWRYIDLPKFVSLLTSKSLWLSNAEVLAVDDPHEASLSNAQFMHRQWRSVAEVPLDMMDQILHHYGDRADGTRKGALKSYMMEQEQLHLYTQFWRRNYYVSCWHAASTESVAMWKVYAAPGPGIAIISNSGRLAAALGGYSDDLYLGRVRYLDEATETVDWSNAFNIVTAKRASFSFEQEVRLIRWDMTDAHDPVDFDSWSDETLRFERIKPDSRKICSGISIDCDLTTLIDRVVVSPFAPHWYMSVIESLREKLGYNFPVIPSDLLKPPTTV